MRFLQQRRVFYSTLALLIFITAVNLYTNRAQGSYGLAGVEEQHLRFLGDSTRFQFALPWVRPAPVMLWVLLFVVALVCALVGYVQSIVRPKLGASPARQVFLGVLLALFALVSMESMLQGYVQLNPSDYYGGAMLWHMRPNVKSSQLTTPMWDLLPGFEPTEEDLANSIGLREREIPFEKRPGEFRIVCIGDSWTWGAFVTASHRWSNRLEALLNKALPDRHITVVNAGMAGHTYLQGYLTLVSMGMQYHPDLVIVGWLHDVDGVNPALDDEDVALLRKILDRTVAYNIVRSYAGGAASDTSAHNVYRQRIIDWLDRKHIPALLIPTLSEPSYPALPNVVPPSEWSPAHPVCGLNMNPAHFIIKNQLMVGPPNYSHRTHPSPDGHAHIAEDLAKFLLSHPWVFTPATSTGR